jgi:hypothetical protein
MERYFIENIEISKNQLVMPAMNYGQERNLHSEKIKIFNYRIELDIADFNRYFSDIYINFIREEKNDLQHYKKGEFEISDIYHELNYPDFETFLRLIKNPVNKELAGLTIKFLEIEFLNALLPASKKTNSIYFIQSIDEVNYAEDKIIICGKSFTTQS